jgi:hypothetical protein
MSSPTPIPSHTSNSTRQARILLRGILRRSTACLCAAATWSYPPPPAQTLSPLHPTRTSGILHVQQVQRRGRPVSRPLLQHSLPSRLSPPPQRQQPSVCSQLRLRQLPAARRRCLQVFFRARHPALPALTRCPPPALAKRERSLSGAASAGTTGQSIGCLLLSRPTVVPAAMMRPPLRTIARAGLVPVPS